MTDHKLASTFTAIGFAGLAAALVVAVGGWLLVDGAADTVRRSLRSAQESVEAAAEAVVIAADTVEQVDAGLEAVELGITGTAVVLDELDPVVEEVARLTAGDIPDSIEAIDDTVSAMRVAVDGLDAALGALSFLGVEEAGAGDLGDSLRSIEGTLDGVPSRLRAQAESLERASAGTTDVADRARQLAERVAAARASVSGARTLIDRYEAAADDTGVLVAEARADLNGQKWLAHLLVMVFAIIIAMLQVVPLTLGRRFAHEADRLSEDDHEPAPKSRSL